MEGEGGDFAFGLWYDCHAFSCAARTDCTSALVLFLLLVEENMAKRFFSPGSDAFFAGG